MGKNILYKKLDILSVMEACEDSSKDFILLFMPSNMGGTIGPDAVGEPDAFLYNEYGDTVDKWRRLYIDYSDATFVTKENYINYIKLLAKIIQNAGRILSERGKFCFAVPTIIKYKKYDQEETPDMLFLIKQIFNRVEIADIPAYSPCADIRSVKEAEYGHYTLYICSKDETCEVGKDEYELDDSDDFFVNYKDGLECIPGAAEKVQQWENISSVFSTSIANKLYIKELRQIDFVRKALLNEIPTAAETVAARCAPRLIISQALSLEDRQANYKVKEQLAEKMRQVIDNPDDDIYISDILMGLYCNSNSRVLFPYDRNGHLAWLAQRRNLNWTSLYKVSLRLEECESRDEDPDSFDDEGNNKNGWEIWEDEVAQRHNDFLTIPPLSNKYAGEQENTYETISALPKRIPIQYDENFLLNVAGAKAAETIIEGGFTYQEIDDGIEIVGYNGPETVILEVPDVINGKSVTSIGGAAFAKNSFSKIRLPNTCKVIKETAFAFCSNLKSIKFPDKLVSIGANAFFHCTNLETVLFNENLMQLGYQSFRGTKIKKIALPPLIKDIPECCFGYCEELENVVLNDGLEEIEENAFTETAIKYIILPESVKQVNGRPSESNYSFPFGKEIGMVVMGENTKFTGIPQRATVWCAPMSKARQQAQNAGAWVEAINEYTDFVKMQ